MGKFVSVIDPANVGVLGSTNAPNYFGEDIEAVRKAIILEGHQIEVVYDPEWVRITIADDDAVEAIDEGVAWRRAVGSFIKNRYEDVQFFVHGGTVREQLEDIISYHFPDGVFAKFWEDDDGTDFGICAVEDKEGNMWRIFSDGDREKYTK